MESSDSNNSGKGEIDLGSGAETEDDEKEYEESAVSSAETLGKPRIETNCSFAEHHPQQPSARPWEGEPRGFRSEHPS